MRIRKRGLIPGMLVTIVTGLMVSVAPALAQQNPRPVSSPRETPSVTQTTSAEPTASLDKPADSTPSMPPSPPETPTDPCATGWCMRQIESDEVGAMYRSTENGAWHTVFMHSPGDSVCARPMSAPPPDLVAITSGADPLWEGYMPDNSSAPDTYAFESKVQTGAPCQGPVG